MWRLSLHALGRLWPKLAAAELAGTSPARRIRDYPEGLALCRLAGFGPWPGKLAERARARLEAGGADTNCAYAL